MVHVINQISIKSVGKKKMNVKRNFRKTINIQLKLMIMVIHYIKEDLQKMVVIVLY